MAENDYNTQQSDWEHEIGLNEETAYVVIYPARSHAELWMEEADEQGRSRSQYLYELIQEARAKRQGQLRTQRRDAQREEELERTNAQLESKIESLRNDDAENVNVDLARIVDPVLTTQYQPFDQLVSSAHETEALETWLRTNVETRLFELVEQDRVEYQGGHGWRWAEGKEER